MDVEFEEMEEWVGDGVYGAVHLALNPIPQFERGVGFGTGWEGYVLEVMLGVLDVFASFSGANYEHAVRNLAIERFVEGGSTYIERFKQVTGILAP